MNLRADFHKKLGDFNLDVRLEAGEEITSILGASGCGKSMTLKCIAGIEKPDRGHIELNGRVLFDSEQKIDLPPQKRGVGYLFQNYALFPDMTVRKNILCGAKGSGSRMEKEEKLRRMLHLFRLEGLEDHKPSQLSGGQQQRTALARIMISEPELLLLDEPFSALDAHLRDALKIEVKELLRGYGKTVLMVTHSRDEAYNMSDRVGVMHDGTLLAVRPVKELFADPGTVQAAVITGCKNIANAKWAGPHEALVPEWGITLQTAQELRRDLTAVGIRAHYFRPGGTQNAFPVVFAGEMEEPFETIQQFRYVGQAEGSANIWWRLAKEKRPQQFPATIGIAPVNVLPLYEAQPADAAFSNGTESEEGR